MKSLNFLRGVLVLAAMVVVFALCVGRANAEFTEGPATNLGPVISTSVNEADVTVTPDGLELYFSSDRPDGEGGDDIWMSERAAPNEPWSEPVNLGPTINSEDADGFVCISADGLELYFASNPDDDRQINDPWAYRYRPDYDLYVTKRASRSEQWEPAENLGWINESDYNEMYPYISADGLKLYFYSNRPADPFSPVFIQTDVWVSTRASKDDNWSRPSQAGTYTTCDATTGICKEAGEDVDVRQGARIFSIDGEYFRIFSSGKPNGYGRSDLWQVQIHPVLDFNGDGIVDNEDLSRLTDCLGQEGSSFDIAPGPYGDGIVDSNDEALLLSYLGQEMNDVSLIAHWKLDETDGNTACDSAGVYDGTVYGEPLRRPDGGMVGGALEFDGIDDCVVIEQPFTESQFDSFSVIAWIKGGAPRQVIFSEYSRANWLMTGNDGGLMTVSKIIIASGRNGGQSKDWNLHSGTVITDGQWHRVCFSWDGLYAILYIDGTEVAMDVRESLNFFTNDMLIGTGRDYHAVQPQSLWTGLIDDVKIYNRAVKP